MIRFVVATLNLWGETRWPARQPALTRFLDGHQPDVLAVQELRPPLLTAITAALPEHDTVDDSFMGWTHESTILWQRDLFRELAHGAEWIGQAGLLRRLFWVRLEWRAGGRPPLLVATAHYTWPGADAERDGGPSPRPDEARRTAAALDRLAPAPLPVLFMGDLNDLLAPVRILGDAGLQEAHAVLGRSPRTTGSPTVRRPPSVADWMLHRGPLHPMCCDAVDLLVDDLAPSDHRPVLTTYRWEAA